jgi:hypothetical protein
MSLATTGGGMGGGGGMSLAMAHHGAGVQNHHANAPPKGADTGHGPPPPSASVLGADLIDKQQIGLKQVKNVAHLPIAAVDLFGSEPCVAMFPPKPVDPSEGILPRVVGKMKSAVYFSTGEKPHKTLRKYLAKSKPYESLVESGTIATSKDSGGVVTLERPHRWLGLRRLSDAPALLKSHKETSISDVVGAVLTNSTLDGSEEPTGDDFDRVVYKVILHEQKKALTLLPEEAVQLVLHQAQKHISMKQKLANPEEVVDLPCAVAVPAWALHDAAIEALYDATQNTGVFFQRGVCALAGALMLSPDGKPNAVLERLQKVREAMAFDFKRRKIEEPNALFEEDVMLLMFGMADDGFEATAIQVSNVQEALTSCLFGDFKVVANVSYQSNDPLSKMEQCSKDLEDTLETIAPEADGPAGIIAYGTIAQQEKIKAQWDVLRPKQKEWNKVPLYTTKPDSIAMGAAILGAVAHGRQSVLVDKAGKTKAELGLRVHNVAPVAVGVRINYHGGDANNWTPVKTVFEFDRRIPAGPYSIDLLASECVLHRSGEKLAEDELLKRAKEIEAAKYIPAREEAALNLRVEVMQKWTRDGEWKRVGDIMEPLVKFDGEGEQRTACESVALELSLGVSGMITSNLSGDR